MHGVVSDSDKPHILASWTWTLDEAQAMSEVVAGARLYLVRFGLVDLVTRLGVRDVRLSAYRRFLYKR